uniref:Uncharacterized protein n=1 Tax=Rousettus aegyptiacus TaxID=9407 RepID=A0A7J8DXB8_ROUAE|nr:hypothetical protein HJG63_008342 [Rousettus aegyptiacus]
MAATHAGLIGALRGQVKKQGQLSLVRSSGLLSKRYGACRSQCYMYGIKQMEMAWVGPQVGRGRVSGNDLGKVTCVIQVDDYSDMVAPAFSHWEGGGLKKGTTDTVTTSVWEKAAPPALALKPNN